MNRDPFGQWTMRRRIMWSVIAAALWLNFGGSFLGLLRPPEKVIYDFYQEWSSARNFLTGRPIYTPVAQTLEPYVDVKAENLYWDINVHPPTSVLLAIPFASLNYYDAMLLWNLVSLAMFAASIALVFWQLRLRFSPWALLPIISVLLLCSPFHQQVIQGQLNFVLLLLLVATWAAGRNDNDVLAGVFLGLAGAIKLFPGFLVVFFLLQRRWRAVASAAITFLLATAATALVFGMETYQDYVEKVLPKAVVWKSTWNNASLAGLWAKLFNPGQAHTLTIPLFESRAIELAATCLSWLVVGGLLAFLTWSARSRLAKDHAFALTITAMLLLSPVTWEHYFLLLLLPLVMLWVDPPPGVWAQIVLALCFVIFCLPVCDLCNVIVPGGFPHGTADPGHTLTLLSIQCYSLCAIFVMGCFQLRSHNLQHRLASDEAMPCDGSQPAR